MNNKVTRRLGTLLLAGAGLMSMACGNGAQGHQDEGEAKLGQLALPLVTQGASGVTYRLRDATFQVHGYPYGGYAGSGVGGNGGTLITVSSEDDPDAQTLSVPLEEGSYYVELLPGWHFEKLVADQIENVEATLLNGETQWVWISRRSTSFAQYEFGLGGRSIWLNGELNIGVVLHEDPSEIGGSGGFGGSSAGAGGFAPPPGGFGGSF